MATLLIWILTGLATAIYASAKNIHHMWLAPCGLMLDALERNEDFLNIFMVLKMSIYQTPAL